MPDVVAVDLGGTNIRAARVNERGEVLARDKTATLAESGMGAVAARMAELVNKVRGPETIGIGVGTPGTPDPDTGVMKSRAVNIPDSQGYPLCPELTRITGLPAGADNDGNLAALGEYWLGAARGEHIVLLFTLGTGIGGACVIDGHVYHGHSNLGTEFGHVSIDYNGRPCPCGVLGCVEQYGSAAAVGRDAREALAAGGKDARASLLWKLCGGDPAKADAKLVCDAVRDGDAYAGALLDRNCDYLATGIGALMNAFNPSCVILGGGMALAGEIVVGRVRTFLGKNRAYAPIFKDARIVAATLGDDAGLIGAARIAFDKAGVKV
ncbi:MAG: ROK family protein [Planctomycetota bacterium]|nr:ROK family protein [Planctomycetota bacterium]